MPITKSLFLKEMYNKDHYLIKLSIKTFNKTLFNKILFTKNQINKNLSMTKKICIK